MAQTITRIESPFRGVDIPSYDVLVNCMHCGLCLPHCPTYALTGLEKSSPRGRIRLIKAVAEGDIPITPGFVEEMNFCLDCQACETVCPAGVKYGSLVEAARAQIFEQRKEPAPSRIAKRLTLDWLFRKQSRLRLAARALRAYEKSGLKWFLSSTALLKVVSNKLHDIQALTPPISSEFSSDVLPAVIRPAGTPLRRVAFLTGCIMDVAYADVNLDTIALLVAHSCEVVIPKGQICCGSLTAHNGNMRAGREFARQNIRVFEREDVDAIVMNSAGCGAFMKDYAHILSDDPKFARRAKDISAKVKDITEFLVEIGFKTGQADAQRGDASLRNPFMGKRVTYHDACHLIHSQKVSQEPRQLIKSIPGIEFVELNESTWCCGSAGIYNITHFNDSMKLLKRKVENIRRICPDVLVTANPGCMVQICHGLKQEGIEVELLHTATFLRRAIGA